MHYRISYFTSYKLGNESIVVLLTIFFEIRKKRKYIVNIEQHPINIFFTETMRYTDIVEERKVKPFLMGLM